MEDRQQGPRSIKYIRGVRLGEGTYGSVYVGTDPQSGRKVAIKEIKRSNTKYNVSFTD
jgi:serine/threonine protein kinase